MLKFLIACFCVFTTLQASAEQTLAIIKPDAVAGNHIGEIITRYERNGLTVVALKMVKLTDKQAEAFYSVHKERPFYPALVKCMSSGPIVAMVLQGDNAVAKNRELIGATDPSKATPGTIRKDFATSMTQNAIHGSDSTESAKQEIAFFFKPEEILVR